MHLAYIWIVSHLSAKNYQHWCKFDEVLTKTNLLSFFGTRCRHTYQLLYNDVHMYAIFLLTTYGAVYDASDDIDIIY